MKQQQLKNKRFCRKCFKVVLGLGLFIGILSCETKSQPEIVSPDGKVTVDVKVDKGVPLYSLFYKGEPVILPSQLGFKLKDGMDLTNHFVLENITATEKDETWQALWGPGKQIRNHYNEMVAHLKHETLNIFMDVQFRVYDDGIGFRYAFPKQKKLADFEIMDEVTEFALPADHTCWWTMADFDSYEKLYNKTPVSEAKWVNTPITMRTQKGVHLSFHEAALTDYAGMTLKLSDSKPLTYKSELVPWADGVKVKTSAPMHTPWRTIQISDDAAGLIESDLIVNLNEPNKIEDTSWITPMKYMGIWWGMHIGTETWTEGSRHGATTENTMRYIDFAAKNNVEGLVVEGWNAGWDKWGAKDAFDHQTAAKDYNLEKVAAYAKEKGVDLIMHHETGGDAEGYEKLMEPAFELCRKLGIRALKTGYAGGIYPRGEHHHGQYMVRHYRKVVETAARYGIMVNAHEPIKPTGIRRTWPNMMTREGVRGMEWNGWSDGNPPSHTVTLPFTRMLAGPVDYTPGTFDVLLENFKEQRVPWNCDDLSKTRVHTTLAKQLGLFAILYSPLQMASDIVDNYIDHPAFKFISDINIDWDESHVLNGEVGEYITMARRSGDEWVLGSATNETPRELNVTLDFLDDNASYTAQIYADADDANWETNPAAFNISAKTVKKGETLILKLAPGGGQAIRFVKK